MRESVVANFATTATDEKTYQVDYYNLDVTGLRQVGKTTMLQKLMKGAVICMKPDLSAIDRDNYIVPIWMI